jgi:hypothetical protein
MKSQALFWNFEGLEVNNQEIDFENFKFDQECNCHFDNFVAEDSNSISQDNDSDVTNLMMELEDLHLDYLRFCQAGCSSDFFSH